MAGDRKCYDVIDEDGELWRVDLPVNMPQVAVEQLIEKVKKKDDREREKFDVRDDVGRLAVWAARGEV